MSDPVKMPTDRGRSPARVVEPVASGTDQVFAEQENVEMLKGAGFKSVEVFFRWYNFCGIVAVK